jgi:hypothetical protein
MSVGNKTNDAEPEGEEDQLPLFDDDYDEMEDDYDAVAQAWKTVADDMFRTIEEAHAEIDKWWPFIPQGRLAERIQKVKKHFDGGGF